MMECNVGGTCCYCHSCCWIPDVDEADFASRSARVRRLQSQRQYATLATAQAVLGTAAVFSGAATICLAIPNAAMPFMSFFPFVSGIMILIGWCFLRTAVRTDISHNVPSEVRKDIALHFVLNIVCLILSAVSIGVSIWGVAICFRASYPLDDSSLASIIAAALYSDDRRRCRPARGAKTAFVFADAIIASALCSTCVAGCVLFCRHARRLEFGSRFRRLERQVFALRDLVSTLAGHEHPYDNEAPV